MELYGRVTQKFLSYVNVKVAFRLKDELLNSVMYSSSAHEIWKKLQEWYESKGKQSIAYLIGQLFCSTLNNSASLGPQLDAMLQKGYTVSVTRRSGLRNSEKRNKRK